MNIVLYFWSFSCIYEKPVFQISGKYNGIYITAEASNGQHIYFSNNALSYLTHMNLVLVELMYSTVVLQYEGKSPVHMLMG